MFSPLSLFDLLDMLWWIGPVLYALVVFTYFTSWCASCAVAFITDTKKREHMFWPQRFAYEHWAGLVYSRGKWFVPDGGLDELVSHKYDKEWIDYENSRQRGYVVTGICGVVLIKSLLFIPAGIVAALLINLWPVTLGTILIAASLLGARKYFRKRVSRSKET